MGKLILSLCLPTNGISEWVFPVLDSIYAQEVDEEQYEVVVTNNGNNDDFHNRMLAYTLKHKNVIYKKTDAYMFENQLEALKVAKGKYFKFVNHRAMFLDGALQAMIDFLNENIEEKPVIFFSNGVLKKNEENYILRCNSFDEFVAKLGRYASWTTGVGIWKDHYDNIPKDKKFDKISPHSGILFSEREKNNYIINDIIFSKELDSNHSQKGKYDLFKAFAVEEFSITLNLYIDGDITARTLKIVKKDYQKYVSNLYWMFCIRKTPCSYDLTGFNDAMGIYFKKCEIIFGAYVTGLKSLCKKLLKK